MFRILAYFWEQFYFTNVVVLHSEPHDTEILGVYSIFPFLNGDCKGSPIESITSFKNNAPTKTVADYFPDKFKNLYNCSIPTLIFNTSPFINISNGISKMSGFDGLVIREISKRLNFSICPDIAPVEAVFTNSTELQKSLDKVRYKRLHLAIGGFIYRTDRLDLLTPSRPHYYSNVIMFIRNHKRSFNSIEILLSPFDVPSWMLILIGLLISKLVFLIIETTDSGKTVVALVSIFFGVSSPFVSKKISGRILICTWLLFSMVFSTIYHAQFFQQMLLHLSEPLPSTLEEIIKFNYTLVVNPFYLILIENIPEIKDKLLKIKVVENYGNIPLKYVAESQEKVVSVGYKINFEYEASIFPKERFHVLKDRFMMVQFCFYASKFSYLIPGINKEVSYLRTAGIIKKYAHDNFSYLENMWRYMEKADKAIGLKELKGIFVLIVILEALAVIVLFIEMFTFKLRKRRVKCRIVLEL